MSSRAWNIVNFILAFLAIVLIIIIYIVVYEHRNDFLRNGIPKVIQTGKIAAIDTMTTGGNNLYLADNKNPLKLTLATNTKNRTGTTIQIKASLGAIDVIPTSPNTISTGSNIKAGETANFTLVGDAWTRL